MITKTLTKTQQQVLEAMLARRARGESIIPALNTKALGGLTQREKNEKIGIYPDGEWVGGRVVKGAGIRTLYALLNLGLVRCDEGIWIAIVPRERLCTPMSVGEASMASSTVL